MTVPCSAATEPAQPPSDDFEPIAARRRRTRRSANQCDAWIELLTQLGWAVARRDHPTGLVLNEVARRAPGPRDTAEDLSSHRTLAELRAALPADTVIAAAEADLLIWHPRTAARPAPAHSAHLTPRETEIWRWLQAGKSADEIATILRRSKRTVQKHQQALYRKLGVHRADQAILAREA